MHQPDPVLTASLYSDRGLDDVIAGAVLPFWLQLARARPGEAWSLWMMRYSRCGDHLKLRLHGPAEGLSLAVRLLADAAESHFSTLLPPEGSSARVSNPQAPPVDADDDQEHDHPDRTLRLTAYRRSHVNLGWKTRLGDDAYVSRMTAALSAGGARVLNAVEKAGGAFPASRRLPLLLASVVEGLAAAGFSAGERTAYLEYHRDWLVRWNVPDRTRQDDAITRFDGRLEEMAAAVAQAGMLARRAWVDDSGRTDGWHLAIADLAAYMARFQDDPDCDVDPFTSHAAFPPLFKVFHNLANTLGVGMLDEAFVHHMLLRATTEVPAEVAAAETPA